MEMVYFWFYYAAFMTGQNVDDIMVSGKRVNSKVPVSRRESLAYVRIVKQIRKLKARVS